MEKEITTVQISVPSRDLLKELAETNAPRCSMTALIEMLIDQEAVKRQHRIEVAKPRIDIMDEIEV